MKNGLAAASLAIGMTMPMAEAAAPPAAAPVVPQQTPLSAADIRARLQQARDQLDKLAVDGDAAERERKSREIAADAIKGLDLAALDAAAFMQAFDLYELAGADDLAAYESARGARAKQPTADGFAVAVHSAQTAGLRDGATVDALLGHPGLQGGCKGQTCRSLIALLSSADSAVVREHIAQIAQLQSVFTADAPQDTFGSALNWVRLMRGAAPADQVEAARKRVLDACHARLAKADDRAKQSLERMIGVLEGAAMRGQLMGAAAPDLQLAWAAHADGSPVEWKTLADLKGKVVVLDFWATWCGPCVGSFPQVAEMRKDYPADKVEIIGVTSLQGHVAHLKRPRADCKGDPAKEKAETIEFMKDMGVTWTVAMSGKDVFNPDFAIIGIPFIAVLDQDGKVYRVGLHPGNDAEVRKTVEELLAKKQ